MDSFSGQTVLWRDYTKGPVTGASFTLSVREGGYLIAGLATFVGFIGPASWSIIAYLLHCWRSRARSRKSQDGVYFQSQVTLRHPSSATAAIWDFLCMCYAWRSKKKIKRVPKLKCRCLGLAVAPLLIFAGFAVVGVFVGRVTARAYQGSDILVKQYQCGYSAYDNSSTEGMIALQVKNAKDTLNARAYARDCYQTNASRATCSLYPKANITHTPSDVDCPFGSDPLGESACLYGNNQALQLDTGFLNSNSIFGINTAPENQLEMRKVTTCSPFHATNYVNQSLEAPEEGGHTIWNFYLGPLKIPGAASSATFTYNTHQKLDRIGYQLYSVYTLAGNSWQPVPALTVPNSDISVYFLSQNGIRYEKAVNDIWFKATRPATERTLFEPDQATNVLACAERYQLRAPSGAQTQFGSHLDLARTYQQVGFNAYQQSIATRLITAVEVASNFNIVTFLGPSSLLASDNLFELVGTTLPSDQWKREVEGWFQTSLARIQWFVIEWSAKLEDIGPYGYVTGTDLLSENEVDKASVRLCSRQRVRNTGAYQTFSFAGVVIVFIVGAAIIVVSWILDWAVGLARRNSPSKSPAHISRITDGRFQLLRKNLVVSAKGPNSSDPWEDIEDSTPVAKSDVEFLIPVWKGDDYHYGIMDEDRPNAVSEAPNTSRDELKAQTAIGEGPSSIPLRTRDWPLQSSEEQGLLSRDWRHVDSTSTAAPHLEASSGSMDSRVSHQSGLDGRSQVTVRNIPAEGGGRRYY